VLVDARTTAQDQRHSRAQNRKLHLVRTLKHGAAAPVIAALPTGFSVSICGWREGTQLLACHSLTRRTMLSFLFRGLTAQPARGAALFDAVTAEARRRCWYVEGEVPDTLDGRFGVLATVAALVLVRLEREGEAGNEASVALTERFVHV